MATRRDVRRYGSATSSDFPKVGDRAEVDNVSGAASSNTLMAPRDSSAITAPPPGRPLTYRQPTLIDARSGQRLGDMTEASPARAVRYLSEKETAARAGGCPCEQATLDHIFGLNLPGRGRAYSEGETS